MISQGRVHHNARPVFLQVRKLTLGTVLLLGSLGLMAGCGNQDGDEQTVSRNKQDAGKISPCPATLDLSGWEAFLALGDQLMSGQQAAVPELEAFGNLPAITLWRGSMAENPPSALKIGNWVEFAFWDKVGNGRTVKKDSGRVSFGKALRFSYDHRLEINNLLASYQKDGHPCQVYKKASYWLGKENLPDPFILRFLAGKPELRSHQGNLIADTSVLLAGGADQLDRQLVALLYRDRQALSGDSPLKLEGAPAVANTLRIMMNEGVAAWIEDMPHTYFKAVHPRLGKVVVIPESIFQTGIRAIDIFNTNLPPMLTDPEAMQSKGQALARAIAGAGAFTQGGYCMAAVIAHRLGEERLHQVRTSPTAFLESYQEAARQNGTSRPIPGAEGSELYETMPAFSDEVYTGLLAVLDTYFP